jgi:hypothetical protein
MNLKKPDKWETKDLVSRLCHALDIAEQTIKQLAPHGYTDDEEPSNNVRPEKVISESALLMLAASTVVDQAGVRRRLHCLAELLIPHARSKRMQLGICLQPALALDYAQAHICLSRLGYHEPYFDKLLRLSFHCQGRSGRERTPYRLLEQEWLSRTWMKRGGFRKRVVSRIARRCVLGQPMDLVGASREDLYAFTHALMYIIDFNIEPQRIPRPRPVILAEAEVALARCLDEEDYDLAGELLLAWPLTGKSWSAAATFCFRVLANVEDQAGFLPAPNTRLRRLNQLCGEKRTKYLLATAYHTAYVMGLLCSAALQPGRTPPAKISAKVAATGCAKVILEHLDTDARNVHWRHTLNQLSGPEHDAIARFLLDIALRRKIGRREFGAVHDLLKLGAAFNLTDSPGTSQAAEMLERLAILADMTTEDDAPIVQSLNQDVELAQQRS